MPLFHDDGEARETALSAAILNAMFAALGGYVDQSNVGGLKVDVSALKLNWHGSHISFSAVSEQSLTDDATNYLYLNSAGTLQISTSAYPDESIRLATVVCAAGAISSITDTREIVNLPFLAGGLAELRLTNLLRNGNFGSWGAGTAVAPNCWTLSGTAAAAARSSDPKFGSYAASLTYGSAAALLYQDVAEYLDYASKVVTFACWIKTSTASIARIQIDDGVGTSESSYHTGGGGYELLRVMRTLNGSPTRLRLAIRCENTGSLLADGALLVIGRITPTFLDHVHDQSIRSMDYQTVTPTNETYGNKRELHGEANVVFAGVATASTAITFPITFSKLLNIQITQKGVATKLCVPVAISPTTAGFTLRADSRDGATFSATEVFYWEATGVE
jgi:hypothetical protein